jgi:hypothetical protein
MTVTSRSASWFIAAALGATLVVGGVQVAAATSHSTIHACQAKSNGALRIASHCTKHEKAISWNRRGPTGKKGKQGPAGTLNGFSSGPLTASVSVLGTSANFVLTSVTVPASAAGNYILTASTRISSTISTETFGTCLVAGAAASTNSTSWETIGTTGVESAFPTMTAEVTVPAGGATLSWECNSNGNVTALTPSLSAVEVSNAPGP